MQVSNLRTPRNSSRMLLTTLDEQNSGDVMPRRASMAARNRNLRANALIESKKP